jgi:S1-C subfamily serine protease
VKRREASFIVATLLAVLAFFVGCAAMPCLTGCATVKSLVTRPPEPGVIGAVLGKDHHTGQLFVNEVPPGMAAANAGIRIGDEVLAIDGAPVAEMSALEVFRRLNGGVGTKVVLLIARSGTVERVELVRGPKLPPADD